MFEPFSKESSESRYVAVIIGLLVIFGTSAGVFAQAGSVEISSSSADSLSEETWSDETYYSIEMLRLERWIRDNTERLADPVLLKEVARLKKEAESAAAEGDYPMAVLLVETIWDLLLPDSNAVSDEEISDDSFLSGAADGNRRSFTWTRQLVTGIDLWRQEFEFAFASGDSTFLEGNGNPYTGVRLSFDYSTSSRDYFQANTFFKYSRDYLSGEVSAELRKPLAKHAGWKLHNRFEVTSFYRDFDLTYFQDGTSLQFNFEKLGPFDLEFEDELLFRRYRDESKIYPNYLNNMVRALLKFNYGGSGSFLGAGVRNVRRLHPTFIENDYNENTFEFIFFQSVGGGSSLSLENQIRVRNYLNVTTITDTTFQFNYWEDYFRWDLRVALSSLFGVELQGSLVRRDYQLRSLITPDYLLWEITPELYFNLGGSWRIASGFHYGNQSHEKLINRLVAVADAARIIQFEDYYTFGPVFTIEFINANGLIFSLRESFQMERYPNSPTGNVRTFSLYSDRNINSVLMLLNWNVSRQWQLGILANMDDDRSQEAASGDSRNTIVGIELNYSF